MNKTLTQKCVPLEMESVVRKQTLQRFHFVKFVSLPYFPIKSDK